MDSRDLDGRTRRTVLAAAAAGTAALAARGAAAQQPATAPGRPVFAYVGSFTTAQRQARGSGVSVYRVDPASGAWTHVQTVGELVNPSFLILSKDQRFLYSVHGDLDYATAFGLDPETGHARVLNRASTGGRNGVRQAIDPSGRFMVVANYASGSVAVLPVQPDGSLRDQVQLVELPGQPGPHRTEQPNSRPHDVVFDPSGRWVAVPDKGLDRTFVFRLDPVTGRLSPSEQGSVKSRAGAGPRHVAFHPTRPVAWVLNELDSTTATYRWDAGRGALEPVQVITTLPTDFTGDGTTAEIAVTPDGRFVYCSNRGHDSVVIYAADPQTGALSHVGWEPTQGKVPRFIGLDPSGRFLHACNEQGDTIVAFRVDPQSGRLTPTGQVVRTGSPVTIAFTGGAA
jgi:6-phosphogluconolactonase (cycloisomerase 2 family)